MATETLKNQIVQRYSSLNDQEQIILLAKLNSRLCLLARGTYSRNGKADSAKLRQITEAINRVSSQLLMMLTNNYHRYPDDVFANILADQFHILNLTIDDFT